MGQEPGQGVAQGGERGPSQPGLQAQAGSEAAQLVVVQSQPGRLHLLLPSPLGAPVLEPNLTIFQGLILFFNFVVFNNYRLGLMNNFKLMSWLGFSDTDF